MIPDGTLTRTFIVRLRRDVDLPGEPREWRGELERVPDGVRARFLGLEGAAEAMRKLLQETEH